MATLANKEESKAEDNKPLAEEEQPFLSKIDANIVTQYESRLLSEEITSQQHKDLFYFPEDDLVVETYNKLQPTTESNPAVTEDLEEHVKDCFKFYSSNWKTFNRKYQEYKKCEAVVHDLPAPVYENDYARSQRAVEGTEQLHLDFLAPYDPETTDKINAQERAKNRGELSHIYNPSYIWEPASTVLCNRPLQKFNPQLSLSISSNLRLLIKMKNLAFQLGEIEPFFCSFSLYDLQSGKQISECFHVDRNSEPLRKLLDKHLGHIDIETEGQCGLFKISDPNPEVYLVLQVEKVLQGDLDSIIEPYLKPPKVAKDLQKQREKMQAEAKVFCKRQGNQRQTFAWSAIPVFGSNLNVCIGKNTKFTNIYVRSAKDDIIDQIKEMKQDPKKRLRQIPGECSIDVFELSSQVYLSNPLFDPSLATVIIPSNAKATSPAELDLPLRESEILREIEEFPLKSQLQPFMSYKNNLYLYPEFLNFSARDRKIRTLMVKIQVKDDDQSLKAPALNVIYGKSSGSKFVSEVRTHATYDNKTPLFHDEIKIKLPIKLTTKHHILFSFYHVAVKPPKDKTDEVERPVGYAVLPLYENGKVVDQTTLTLPVFTNDLEPKYLTENSTYQYVEGGKGLFRLRLKLLSTVYTDDPKLNNFFKSYASGKDKELEEALVKLREISLGQVMEQLPVLINQLIRVMNDSADKFTQITATGFQAFVDILDKANQQSGNTGSIERPRASYLNLYHEFIYDNNIKGKEEVPRSFIINLLLFCMQKIRNPTRYPDISIEQIFTVSWFFFEIVIKSLTLSLDEKWKNKEVKEQILPFDSAVAKYVRQIVKFFAENFKTVAQNFPNHTYTLNKNLSLFIRDMMSVFDRGHVMDWVKLYLTTICETSSEAGLAMKNDFLKIVTDHEHYIPLNLPVYPTFTNTQNLLTAVSSNHPLATALVDSVLADLKANSSSKASIIVLNELICKHDYDTRYQIKEKRERVALVYFPVILLLLDYWPKLSAWNNSADVEEQRNFYLCVLYVVKNINRPFLRNWWNVEVTSHLVSFFDALDVCIKCFEYQPSFTPSKKAKNYDFQVYNRKLGTEVSLVILDVIEDFVEDYQKRLLSDQSTILMDKLFGLLTSLLEKNQSERFVSNLFASLRTFIVKFRQLIFAGNNNYCADLVSRVLALCNYASPKIRSEAVSMLYLMAKHNFIEVGNCVRMSVHATTSLSRFQDDLYIKRALATFIQYALYEYSTADMFSHSSEEEMRNSSFGLEMKVRFARSVEEMSGTLTQILKDSIAIHKVQEYGDPEMLAELFFRISLRYQHTPSIRVYYLELLAKHHVSKSSFAEAAICYTHIAALLAEYLKSQSFADLDTSAFKAISPFIEELADLNDESTSHSTIFQEENVIKYSQLAAETFEKANMFEFANETFKVITAIHEKNLDYRAFSNAHLQISKYFSSLESNNEVRFFGRYFRVGFFSSKFGDLDGKEFVYKEPELTHLFEISNRLKTFYGSKFGEANVSIWPDSGKVDRSKLDPNKAYLQITHLEIYFEPEELKSRKSFFMRNTNLSRFVFTTPFTKSGKAQGNTAEQYKRKTIVIVDTSFPSMLKRLPITSKREVIMDPVECAIEVVEMRINAIHSEVVKKPPNSKTLQQVLQGSVRLQVNAGAVDFCKVFLGENETKYPPSKIELLRTSLRDFLSKCHSALELNETLITNDQVAFQSEMRLGYEELLNEMSPYLETVAKPVAIRDEFTDPRFSSLQSDDATSQSDDGVQN